MQKVWRFASAPWLVVLLCWLLAVGGRIAKHGTAFGLNYELYQPDGGRYIGFASALINRDFTGIDRITASRPLYSLLSVPFYAVAGDPGMLVIPALSLLIVGLCILAIGSDLGVPWVAVAAFAALSASVTVNRWMIADITDSPHLAVFAIACLALTRRARPLVVLILLLLALLTRPAGPAWIALLLPLAVSARGRARSAWIGILAIAAAVTAATLVLVPDVSGFDPTGKVAMGDRLLRLPQRMLSIPFIEFAELAALDRLLLAFVLITLVLAWRRRTQIWSQTYLLVMAVTLFMGAWNGVYGVNFRYQLPALIPAAIVLLEWAADRTLPIQQAAREAKAA